ncbi:MAG: right-handed parallel beta-helix repeat-containing protein [Anaerolineae bacterium]|nr:right-handed parallel beta-helix repeat-containing protein [Anaerolineae bacterium]
MMSLKVKSTRFLGVLFLVVVGSLLWAAGLGYAPGIVWAAPSDMYGIYYVAPGGVCGSGYEPCFAEIQFAIDAADEVTDVIKIAAGVYTHTWASTAVPYPGTSLITQVVYLSKTLHVQGGYAVDAWETAYPLTQTSVVDAQGRGRGIVIAGDVMPVFEGLHITGGNAQGLKGGGGSHDAGGGGYIITASATISQCYIYGNEAQDGGGLYVVGADNLTLKANRFESNHAGYAGGGLYLYRSAGDITQNTFFNNGAYSYGGGVFMFESYGPRLQMNTVISNYTEFLVGGGIVLNMGRADMIGNVISGNVAAGDGGGVNIYWGDGSTLVNNIIRTNRALNGGGIWINSSPSITLTNNLVADNYAEEHGAGIFVSDSRPLLRHTTLARNTGDAGLYVTYQSEPTLINTILVSHTRGITIAAGCTATLEATVWGAGAWANGTDQSGAGTLFTGTVNLWVTPDFVAPESGDYHLGENSQAIDAGVNAGVAFDMDGDTRPTGAGYDIGADEWVRGNRHIYLPLIIR